MKNFKELSKESNGNFTVEPNELTEIHVNIESQNVTVEVYPFKNHMKGTPTKETFRSGMVAFGGKSLETVYNEIINKF